MLRFAALICAAFLSLAAPPARADQTDDIIGTTLDAFIVLGPKYGFNITPNEKKFVAPFASCIVRGKPVVDCSKETIISFLPEKVQPIATCVASGKPVNDCAINLVPEELQAASRCANEVLRQEDACIKEQLIKRIPDERTRNLANCLNTPGASPIQCAAQFGQGDVAEALSKVGGRSSEAIGKPEGLMSKIIGVISGIQNKDFAQVLRDGGEAVAKIVARVALNILTAGTPFVNYVSGDIIDAVIEHRIDALVDVFNAVNNRDPGALTTVIINAYYTSFAVVPCTAMRTVFPIDAVPDALCGFAGDVFGFLGRVGGGAVGEAYNALVKGLEGLGVFDFFGQVGDLFSDDAPPAHCKSSQHYFTEYQLQCVRAAVTESIAATTLDGAAKEAAVRKMRDIVGHVQDGCRVWFEQCYDGTKTIDKYCLPLLEPFTSAVEQTGQGIYDAARRYGSKAISDAYTGQRASFCQSPEATSNLLKLQCEDFLRKRFPMKNTPIVLFQNARDDADEIVEEHRNRRCTPTNYQMSSASSAETLACAFIGERVANLCQPKKPWHFEVKEESDPIRPQDKVKTGNAPFPGQTGGMSGTEQFKTHMTAVSIAASGGLAVGPRPPLTGGTNSALPGESVRSGPTVRDTVRVNPTVRTNTGVAAPQGGMYQTGPNPQIQQQTISPQQRFVNPNNQLQPQDTMRFRSTTINPPQPQDTMRFRSTTINPPQQQDTIRFRSTTINPPKQTGGMYQTGPGSNVKPSGGMNSTGAGLAQQRTKAVNPTPTPDKRINYGACSECKPPPPPKFKLN